MLLDALRRWDRVKARIYTTAIGRELGACGHGTVLIPPVRLHGEDDIYLGVEVFIGRGSWLQTVPQKLGGANGVLRVGSGTRIGRYCVISAAAVIDIGASVLMGQNVLVVDHNHGFSDPSLPIRDQGIESARPVRIEAGSWLGQNAIVCAGVTIGERAVIAANAVVTHDVPAGCLAGGVPAKVIRDRASEWQR
jgi:acetyltransferase-like isoleucine patch superfamily enzyme